MIYWKNLTLHLLKFKYKKTKLFPFFLQPHLTKHSWHVPISVNKLTIMHVFSHYDVNKKLTIILKMKFKFIRFCTKYVYISAFETVYTYCLSTPFNLSTQGQKMVLQDSCFTHSVVLLCPSIFEKQRIFVVSAVKQC